MTEKKRYFIFYRSNLLLEELSDHVFTIPLCDKEPVARKPEDPLLEITPMEDGTKVFTYAVDGLETAKKEYHFCDLRKSFYHLPPDLYRKAGQCHEMIYWDRHTQFCGICGAPMAMHTKTSKRCSNCGNEVWPVMTTAIIVLIQRGDELLLVHARDFKSDFYGLVAGFVETGETLEQAVRREAMEETGLAIKNLRYMMSQPWPYPCGLMVGFYADYDAGELVLQSSELTKGGWFHRDNLPRLPEKLSIARKLIDNWLRSFRN